MMLYGKKYGGADPQLIEGDNFRMIISIPEFGKNPAQTNIIPTPQVTAQVTPQVTAQVTAFCIEPRSARDIMGILGIKHWKTFQNNYLSPLIKNGFLERTIPDKPNSRLQKYRLTASGREWIKNNAL